MAPGFAIETVRSVSSVVVFVRGDLDVTSAPTLEQVLGDLVDKEGGRSLVVDVSEMEFIDSSGLRVLVGGLLKVRHNGGTLRLEGASPHTTKLLEITGARALFDTTGEGQLGGRLDGAEHPAGVAADDPLHLGRREPTVQ